jgi:hypothetical protein
VDCVLGSRGSDTGQSPRGFLRWGRGRTRRQDGRGADDDARCEGWGVAASGGRTVHVDAYSMFLRSSRD